jgi:hypothetical protein
MRFPDGGRPSASAGPWLALPHTASTSEVLTENEHRRFDKRRLPQIQPTGRFDKSHRVW